MHGADLGHGLGDGAARVAGGDGGQEGRGAAVGRLRGGRVLGCFACGDVGGVVAVAGDALGEGASCAARQRRGGVGAVAGGRCGEERLSGARVVLRVGALGGFLRGRGLGGLVRARSLGGCGGGQVAGLVDGCLDDGHLVGGATAEEEGAQLHGGFLGEDAADDLGGVGHAGVAQDVAQGAGCAGLGVPGAEDDAVDARGEDGPGAHGAGLEGDDERAAAQSPRAQGAGGFSQGDDFGVTSGVVVGFAAVPASTDDATVGVDNDGSDGDVSRFTGAICQEKGLAHRFTVLLIHCHPPSLPAKSTLGEPELTVGRESIVTPEFDSWSACDLQRPSPIRADRPGPRPSATGCAPVCERGSL